MQETHRPSFSWSTCWLCSIVDYVDYYIHTFLELRVGGIFTQLWNPYTIESIEIPHISLPTDHSVWLDFSSPPDHCLRRVENRLQEPYRPVRFTQPSCFAWVSLSLKFSTYSKFTYHFKLFKLIALKIYPGTSCTFSSTSCSWLLASGSAFCSMLPWSATTSTGTRLEIDLMQMEIKVRRIFSRIFPAQIHEPACDVWSRSLWPHLHHECWHLEQVPGALLIFN